MEEDDAEAQAMAAAMGFSSFGSKPPAKKRKFNTTTDAFVDGQDLAKLDKGGRKGQGSGGNTIPLGKARVFGTAVSNKEEELEKANEDEIDLDDEEEQDGPQYIDTSLPPPIETAEDEGPQYIDTSQPPPVSDQEAREVQARIDALLASLAPMLPPGESSTDAIPASSGTDAPGTYSLPQRPPTDTAFMQGQGRAHGRQAFNDTASASSSRPSQRGQRNENWFVDYYDPNFNQNPWDRLEKDKGLEPLCKWPENIGRQETR